MRARRVTAIGLLLLVGCRSLAAAAGGVHSPSPAIVEPATGAGLLLIPGGEFTMGSSAGRPDETPPHPVRLDSFYLGRHEVTQDQWIRVMGTNPSRFTGCGSCPVEGVSWHDVQEFLHRARSSSDLKIRLPTEAEWEYAAGGGRPSERWPGTDRSSDLAEFAWFSGSFSGKTRPVGSKEPNLFGLHDMAGNVAEWCSDWYERDYYGKSLVDNPGGPAAGTRRVTRGGSWLGGADDLRLTRRSARHPDARSPSTGFRLAADAIRP